ncbi:MAG TPA: glycosyltransferase [Bacteroidales bacterium]|nr:glycosyltransferase [Bacteroidales bacterium]
MEYNYSIIIPHHNIPELLKRCVASIPERDDIQIIIVDDKSSPEKVDFNIFPDIERDLEVVLCKESGGAGNARNIGLSKAKGDWILFADADDFFSDNAFEVFDKYLSTDFDVIHFTHGSCFSDTLEVTDRADGYSRIIQDYIISPNFKNTLKLKFWTPTPCGKLVRRKIITKYNIQFDKSFVANDVMFSAKLGVYSDKHLGVNEELYIATLRKGSLTQIVNRDTLYIRFNTRVRFNRYMKDIGYPQIQMNLASKTLKALFLFGPVEFYRYLKLGYQYKINVFRAPLLKIFNPRKIKRIFNP